MSGLAPVEGLAQQPNGKSHRYKEQTQADWRAPAKPGAPRAPVFHGVLAVFHGFFCAHFVARHNESFLFS